MQVMREVYDARLRDAMSRPMPPSARYMTPRARLLLVCLLLGAPAGAGAQLVGVPASDSVDSRRDVLHRRDTLATRSFVPLRRGVDDWRQRPYSAHAWPVSLAPTDTGPSVWKYVGWGALIGGALTGGYAAYRTRDCDDCMFTGLFIGGAAGIGAVLGGFIASIVYADRYWSDGR